MFNRQSLVLFTGIPNTPHQLYICKWTFIHFCLRKGKKIWKKHTNKYYFSWTNHVCECSLLYECFCLSLSPCIVCKYITNNESSWSTTGTVSRDFWYIFYIKKSLILFLNRLKRLTTQTRSRHGRWLRRHDVRVVKTKKPPDISRPDPDVPALLWARLPSDRTKKWD